MSFKNGFLFSKFQKKQKITKLVKLRNIQNRVKMNFQKILKDVTNKSQQKSNKI